MKCSECEHQYECHNESTHFLTILKEIEKGQNQGFSYLAYDATDRLRHALERRHRKIMTGGECNELK